MNKTVYGWKGKYSSAFLQLVIDPDTKTLQKGYYLNYFTDHKVKTKKRLQEIEKQMLAYGYSYKPEL